jgi:hypothetical protein
VLSQRIMWTVLPFPEAAPGGPTVRFSVVVSPRLRTDEHLPRPTLQQFPDFVDWPAVLQHITWVVRLDGVTHTAQPVSTARSQVWTEFFADRTFVRPETFADLTKEVVHSYPADHTTSFLLDRYATVAATSPTEFPAVDWLHGPDGLGPITPDPDALAAAAETVQAQLDTDQAVPPGPADPPVDFYQLRRFLQPRGKNLVDDIEPFDPDFHEIVAMTADHPGLQRLLGLVIDLELPRSVLPAPGSKPLLSVEPQWQAKTVDSADQRPGIRCVVDDGPVLRPLDTGSTLSRGRLLLSKDAAFQVIQIDQDSAAINAMSLAGNLATAAQQPTVAQPGRYALPALRSAGLALAARGRARQLVRDLARSRDLYLDTESGNPVELTAPEAVRGYRVDVFHTESGTWFPLHGRESVYRLPSGNVLKTTDEGTLIPSPTSAADGSAQDLFHQETLFHWMGWSLAVRRPGTAIDPDEQIQVDPSSAPSAAYPMDVRMQVPQRTLPRLRFGNRYRLRLRAVDVAGNSLPFTPDPTEDPDFITAEVTYGRYEPVPTPRIVARHPMTVNEDVDRLVIRSNFDTPATGDSQRHVLPTAAAQLLAEQHGRFDTPGPASEVDRGIWADITKREGQTLEALPSARTDPDRPGETYHDVAELPVPYLPDPLTRGASFTGLPSGNQVKVDFTGVKTPWYETRSCRVVLNEGATASAVFDTASRELRVTLPKGAIVTTRLSSYLTEADLPQLGIWHLLQAHPIANLDGLKPIVVDGRHWMITPHRSLTFVHAVRQPVIEPRFGTLDAIRNPGDTWVDYQAPTQLHRASTARVDVLAEWSEIVDRGPGTSDPDTASYRTTAFTHPVVEIGNAQADLVTGRHELGDTRHRRISYTAVATSRFVAYFARRTTVTLTGTTPQVLDAAGLVDGSVTVSVAGGQYQSGRDYDVDLTAGTIARTDPSGIPDGQQLTVQYTALPVTRTAAKPESRDVPSTAPPPAPAVRYAVPAFTWSRTKQGDVTISRRTGSTLRIYLDRPWYTTGDGELLGVVLERSPAAAKPQATRDQLDNLTTLLGEDPAYRTGSTLVPALTTAHFPEAVAAGTDLPLEGAPEHVDVAGHRVAFDSARGLWFCDMPIVPGPGYTPLVRPALVRYQPDSLAGLHLSPAVLLDFLPLLPNRETQVTPGADTSYAITVTGPGYLSTDAAAQPSRIVVTAQQQDPAVPGELGWAEVGTGVELTAVAPGQPGGPTVWSGQIKLPPGAAAELARWRLVIEEFERLASATTDDVPHVSERLSFLDTIPLAN